MRRLTLWIFLAAFASTVLAQPTVTVSPKSGPPTEEAAVSGTGFGANQAVDIYFDTTDLALVATGPSGAFNGIRLTIPASATPARHWITAVGWQHGLAPHST